MKYWVMRGNTHIGPFHTVSAAAFVESGMGYQPDLYGPKMYVTDNNGKRVDTSRLQKPAKRRRPFWFQMTVKVHNPNAGYAAIQKPVNRWDWLRAVTGRYC